MPHQQVFDLINSFEMRQTRSEAYSIISKYGAKALEELIELAFIKKEGRNSGAWWRYARKYNIIRPTTSICVARITEHNRVYRVIRQDRVETSMEDQGKYYNVTLRNGNNSSVLSLNILKDEISKALELVQVAKQYNIDKNTMKEYMSAPPTII